MGLAAFALKRPYTIIASIIVVCLMGIGAALRMPIDIFPEIDIPVVSVVWTYSGMSAQDMRDRILTLHERQLASLVDDISRIEATSYAGVGVEKVYLHEGANVTRAISQLASSALVVLKYMPPNTTPPLVLRYGATDVPIIQLSISSNSLTDAKLNDLGQNIIRPDLAVVHGAEVPYPYGGKPRVIMVDLDQAALGARGLSPSDVAAAIQRQNVILPSGDVKIGAKDYALAMNSSPDAIAAINQFPVKQEGGKTVFVRDVAHVHDGYQTQTNSVTVDGRPGALMTVRKTGGVSTLAVVSGIKKALPDIARVLPKGAHIKAYFDQSIFVKASLDSVLLGGAMAAGLTSVMILLFLGNWRLTLIILATIPLAIITAVLVMYIGGQTLNTMTLGGFALAVGILVDNSTVVIENIERHVRDGEPLERSIIVGASEVAIPTALATLCICIVFVPVFLLQGTARYLFSPLSLSVCVSLIASLVLSFTLVPVLFAYLMRSSIEKHVGHVSAAAHVSTAGFVAPKRRGFGIFGAVHQGFESSFEKFREVYRNVVAFCVARPGATSLFFALLLVASLPLFPKLGEDFFPQVDAGQMRLHVRAPPASRLEETQHYFSEVERAIRDIVGQDQIDVILDNIGLPYSGINIALSDSSTIGPMDGEILISLKSKHTPTSEHVAALRRELPKRFPSLTFFFQPADIINQVLNFGQSAPIDVRISGPKSGEIYALAQKIAHDLNAIPGVVDSHVFQIPSAPALTIDIDRSLAQEFGLNQSKIAKDVLITTNSSAQTVPNFWIDPKNNVSYPLVVQMPTYKVKSTEDLADMPVTADRDGRPAELLANVAKFGRKSEPLVASQLNIRPVFDVNADVQGRDLASAADAIEKVLAADRPAPPSPITVTLSGQIETMRESFDGLFSGMALAVILVYLALVINFQSWIDPLIVLSAVPFTGAGVIWMLFLTQTHLSVPALMGALMCIGLTSANSILVVTFANQRKAAGDTTAVAAIVAGYMRIRPVFMTAGAMILGMIPMALGVGEGGEQNAPLARAVIGGLVFATVATLILVPVVYRALSRSATSPSRHSVSTHTAGVAGQFAATSMDSNERFS
jgi:multidrug efflux pump subunit AcrB